MVKSKTSRNEEKLALFEKAVKLGLPNSTAVYNKMSKDDLKFHIEVSTPKARVVPVIPTPAPVKISSTDSFRQQAHQHKRKQNNY